jgi:hypothetical protein
VREEVVEWMRMRILSTEIRVVRDEEDNVCQYDHGLFAYKILKALQAICGSIGVWMEDWPSGSWMYWLATAVMRVYGPLCKGGFTDRKQAYAFLKVAVKRVLEWETITQDWVDIYLVMMGMNGGPPDDLFMTCIPQVLPSMWILRYRDKDGQLVQPKASIRSLESKLCFLIVEERAGKDWYTFIPPKRLKENWDRESYLWLRYGNVLRGQWEWLARWL